MAKQLETKTNAEYMEYSRGKKYRIFQDWSTNTLIHFHPDETWVYDSEEDNWTKS
jgi:hypothetical protein